MMTRRAVLLVIDADMEMTACHSAQLQSQDSAKKATNQLPKDNGGRRKQMCQQ